MDPFWLHLPRTDRKMLGKALVEELSETPVATLAEHCNVLSPTKTGLKRSPSPIFLGLVNRCSLFLIPTRLGYQFFLLSILHEAHSHICIDINHTPILCVASQSCPTIPCGVIHTLDALCTYLQHPLRLFFFFLASVTARKMNSISHTFSLLFCIKPKSRQTRHMGRGKKCQNSERLRELMMLLNNLLEAEIVCHGLLKLLCAQLTIQRDRHRWQGV